MHLNLKQIVIRLPYIKLAFVLILIFFSFPGLDITAQEPVPVQKSENKVIIEGRIYYLHVVKAGQTLYSISRAYGLKEPDIEKENPGVMSGIKIGQVLKIPVESTVTASPVIQEKDTSLYIHHVLMKGETLFSLSGRYNTSLAEIEKLNPGIDPSALKEGQIIYLPKPVSGKPGIEYINHKVRRKETLYSISRTYNVSIDEIQQHNPDLLTGTLRTGQMLRIPKIIEVTVVDVSEETDEFSDSLIIITETDSTAIDTVSIYADLEDTRWKKSIDVAFLIPFNFRDTTDTLYSGMEIFSDADADKAANLFPDAAGAKPFSVNYLEFLEGSLLALDSLKKKGISVNMKVVDTHRSPEHVRSIVASGDLNNLDLIIGPFFLFNAEIVSDFSRENRIPMVVPLLSSDSLLKTNPYLFQLNPSNTTELNGIAEYVSQFKDYNIVLFYATTNNEPGRAKYLKQSINKELIIFKADSINEIKEVVYDPAQKTDLSAMLAEVLSAEKNNVVIIPSTNEAFVYIAVTQLFFQLRNFNIEIIGMPQWSVFQNVDLLYLHKLNLRYLTPYYFSYDDFQIRHFLKKWRNEFWTEPVSTTRKGCNYAFLGFDVTWYFLNSYYNYGKRFVMHPDNLHYDTLMNPFHLRKKGYAGGFENTSLKVVRYTPDYLINSESFIFRQQVKQPTFMVPEAVQDVIE